MSERILVIDDEPEIADLIELYLLNERFTVYKFNTAAEAASVIDAGEIDLAILDIMLPDTNGLLLCRQIRERHTYPIIMLTAKDDESDKIAGLTYGADDYVTKPFRPLELVARVKAQLRRYKTYNPAKTEDAAPSELMTHKGLVLNSRTYQCFLNEEPLSLTPTEFAILKILLERKGEVVSSEALFYEIWQEDYYTKSNNTISVHIRHLREKLKDSADKPKYIKTVWGVGYKIETNL